MVAAGDLRVVLHGDSRVPLPEQIVRSIRRSIVDGVLRPGDRLPSSRALAEDLAVARGTVEAALGQLEAEGYLLRRPRSGTFVDPAIPASVLEDGGAAAPESAVASGSAERGRRTADGQVTARDRTAVGDRTESAHGPRAHHARLASDLRADLRPGQGGGSPLGESRFRAAWRRALDRPDVVACLIDPLGLPELRVAISEHLRVMRGMRVDPADVIVTGGSRDGAGLVLQAIGARATAVEDPGFPGLRSALSAVDVVPVPVGDDGPSPAALESALSDPRGAAVLVTPNHQYPYGDAMSAAARATLGAWAAERGALLLEDDYDSEARYLSPANPPLYDTAPPGTVVHIGTFSTVLTRAVGTGYVIAAGEAGEAIRDLRTRLGPGVPPIMQAALAGYLESGGLRARIARGRRRARAAEALVRSRPPLPGMVDGGHTLVVETDEGTARALHRRLARRGILVGDLAAGWSGSAVRHGVVLAHANAAPEELDGALDVIAEVLERDMDADRGGER